MQILERACIGKDGQDNSGEDLVIANEYFAAVIDGATDKSGMKFGGLTGGQLASQSIAKAIRELDPEADLPDLVSLASSQLTESVKSSGADVGVAVYPSAVFVVYSKTRQQIWRIGDCSWRADGVSYIGAKKIDAIASNTRSAFLHAKLLQGSCLEDICNPDLGREVILPLLELQGVFCNIDSEFGYPAINGAVVPERFYESWSASEFQEIVLASDGYPELHDTLSQTESALMASLSEDPMRIGQYRSTKGLSSGNQSFDDRSYLKIRV